MNSLPAYLTQRYQVNGSACWSWTGATQSKGYGSLTDGNGSTVLAHRAVWEWIYGPIPDGMTVDHLCRNKLCGNPDHLDLATAAENARRSNAAVTACPRGHAYSEDNTGRGSRGSRYCLTCAREAKRLKWPEYWSRHRAEVNARRRAARQAKRATDSQAVSA